jgi:transcriptional regulator GlxA family with amidase domain
MKNSIKHISILIPKGETSVSNIEGTSQILNQVNLVHAQMNMPPAFKIQYVGISKEASQRDGQFTIRPDVLIKDLKKTDIIIIPAMFGDQKQTVEDNKEFIPWITKQYQQGADLVTFCIGAFFLASTGLLNGKQCSTHWLHANEFRKMFPDVNLMDDKIMTEDDRIYTSGGAYSFLNLLIYLIEKYAGRETAIFIAKAFMIDIDRYKQSPFIIFQGQKTHEDEPVKKAQEFIENNFQEKITIEQLAKMLAMGRRSLERRFKSATSNTVTEYIQRVKIEAAKKSLESSNENVNEVMYKVGYMDPKAFRVVFKKVTGLSPIEYKNKYNREVSVYARNSHQ